MKNLKHVAAMCLAASIAVTMGAGFAACGGRSKSGMVTVSGSTSVQPVMMKLADAFTKETGVKVDVQGGGSSVGISAASKGESDIGMVSRLVADKEANDTGLDAKKLCDDGIVLIVKNGSALDNVTSAQVFDLYTAGTPIGDITVPVNRESGSGTRDGFNELIKNADGSLTLKKFAETAKLQGSEYLSTGLVMSTIENAQAGNAIGYISLGSLNNTVQPVKFENVEASVANIKSGDYGLQRPFYLVKNKTKTFSADAQKFWDFLWSESAQNLLSENGYVV